MSAGEIPDWLCLSDFMVLADRIQAVAVEESGRREPDIDFANVAEMAASQLRLAARSIEIALDPVDMVRVGLLYQRTQEAEAPQ